MTQVGKFSLGHFRFRGLRYPAKYVGIVWAAMLLFFFFVSVFVARHLGFAEQYPRFTKLASFIITGLFWHKLNSLFMRHQWQAATLFCLTLSVILFICGGVEYINAGRDISSKVVGCLIIGGTAFAAGIFCGIRWWLYMRRLRERVALRQIAARRKRQKTQLYHFDA